jgi:hypothetical protein
MVAPMDKVPKPTPMEKSGTKVNGLTIYRLTINRFVRMAHGHCENFWLIVCRVQARFWIGRPQRRYHEGIATDRIVMCHVLTSNHKPNPSEEDVEKN